MDTFCHSPVMTNTQRENSNIIEMLNNLDGLSETLKGLTIDSTIKNSAYYDSDKDDAEGNPKSNPLVTNHTNDGKKRKVTYTDTTNVNSPQKSLINRTVLVIIQLINHGLRMGLRLVEGLCMRYRHLLRM